MYIAEFLALYKVLNYIKQLSNLSVAERGSYQKSLDNITILTK